jgi:ligand-binding sensor domain-containing protein
LAQTSDGFLWVGSPDGLYRFDGEVFERYQPQSGDPFPVNSVGSLLALPNGDLWIGFSSGTISLLRTGRVTDYTTRNGLPAGGIWSIAQDRDGTLWAATHAGLARLEGSRWKEVGKDWNFPAGLVRTIFLDRQGTLWVSTEDTLVFLPAGAKKFQSTSIRVGQVSQIAQARNGKLWMAETSRSVRPIPLSDLRQPPDETGVRVGSLRILFDNDGALWITSYGDGLRRSRTTELLRGRIGEFSTVVESFASKDGLSDDFIRAILQDREGNVWVGTDKGLDRFRRTDLVSLAFPFKLGVECLGRRSAGDLWIENGSHGQIRGAHDPNHALPRLAISAYREPAGATVALPARHHRYDAGSYMDCTTTVVSKPYTEGDRNDGRPGTLWLAGGGCSIGTRENGSDLRPRQNSPSHPLWPASRTGMAAHGSDTEGGTIIVVDHGRSRKFFCQRIPSWKHRSN